MKVTKASRSDIGRIYQKTKVYSFLEEVMNTGYDCVLVEQSELGEYSNAKSMHSVLYQSIKRFGFPLRVIMKSGKVYLIRLEEK